MLLYWYFFVVLGDTSVYIRDDIPILGLGFHKGVFPGTAHCVKGNWDPNSALIPVGTDSYSIPKLTIRNPRWWNQWLVNIRLFVLWISNTDLHFPDVLCCFEVLLCLDFEAINESVRATAVFGTMKTSKYHCKLASGWWSHRNQF